MLRRFPPGLADCRRNGGFALILVLWTLVLIGFIVAHLTASGRTEIRIAGNLVANSASQAAADGAVFEAIFNLSDPQPERRWPVDGTPRQVTVGSSRVILRIEDEASWINPSAASPVLLEALLRVTGSDPDTARRIATAMSEWVGSATVPRPQEAVAADYRAAGLDYGPPSAPFETLGELGRVLGMTPAVLMAIRPHLTLFGPPEPNPVSTDPVVAAALALSSPASQPVAQPGQASADNLTVRITALASGPGNARVTRTAVVRTGATLPQGYAVLAWGNSLDSDAPLGSPRPPVTR
jgi:general secretion pathway protein K